MIANPQTKTVAQVVHELRSALRFCKSVIAKGGIFDLSEGLAVEHAEKAEASAVELFGELQKCPPQNPSPVESKIYTEKTGKSPSKRGKRRTR